ncbi:MAG: DEAD/DEAH box helicase [Caulobacterales bacterium]
MSQDYLSDPLRVSIRREQIQDGAGYEAAVAGLERLGLWAGSPDLHGLWRHQQEAVAFAAAYLCSDKTLAEGLLEAALIKMPTGTGKSGVVALVTRCLPQVRRALVLTPRTALTEQLKDDIAFRFWGNMGLDVKTAPVWSGAMSGGGDVDTAEVEKLLPNLAALRGLSGRTGKGRLVVVGTLQALDQIRTLRDRIERKMRRGRTLTTLELNAYPEVTKTLAFLKGFDLVVVDEGHYEPAPSWSRSVRALARPTILLSATPFRNDYKLFQVKGRFVFNFPFPAARDGNIIRDVTLAALGESGPAAGTARARRSAETDEDTDTPGAVTPEDRGAVVDCVAALKRQLPPILDGVGFNHPKVIVRGGSFEILELLQAAIQERFKELPVLVHERINNPSKDVARRRYRSVDEARKAFPDARFWLHQTKLLEGIDEPTFVVAALFDPFTNARQLVQQIGRVLRSTDKSRQVRQTAHILIPKSALAEVEAAWAGYLGFEDYSAQEGLGSIVPSEAYLPEEIVQRMPQMQYVDGLFRQRLPDDISLKAEDIIVPRRAAVFDTEAGFDLAAAADEIRESVLARNRFVVRSIEDLPADVLGWTFFTVDESPYLANHFVTEWRFGVVLAAQVNDHVFVFDSDGLAFNPGRIDLSRADEATLTRLLPTASTITRVAANSLDMSDRAIRSLAQRTRSFADTFTDLLDPMLKPTTVTGFVGGVGRYLGVVRAKVADAVDANVSIPEYLDWLRGLDRQLSDKAAIPNPVFRRYAKVVTPDPQKAENPANILLDLTEEAMQEFGLRGDLDADAAPKGMLAYEDFCVDIVGGKFKIRGLDGVEVECVIQFNRESGRYKISSAALNARHPPTVTGRAHRAVSLTEQLNTAQSFRVLTGEDGVVYMYGQFVKARDMLAADGTVLPLEGASAVPGLGRTKTEKGEKIFADPVAWATTSVFGLTKTYCDRSDPSGDAYERALADFDLVLLDDDSSEVGGFLAIGERRLAIIHAKASAKVSDGAVTKLEAVGRQAVASLAFCATAAQVDGLADDRWRRPTVFNGKTVKLSRVYRNRNGLQPKEIGPFVRKALMNPSFSREV